MPRVHDLIMDELMCKVEVVSMSPLRRPGFAQDARKACGENQFVPASELMCLLKQKL